MAAGLLFQAYLKTNSIVCNTAAVLFLFNGFSLPGRTYCLYSDVYSCDFVAFWFVFLNVGTLWNKWVVFSIVLFFTQRLKMDQRKSTCGH